MKRIKGFVIFSFFTFTLVLSLIIPRESFAHRPLITEDAGVGAMKEVVIEASWERFTIKSWHEDTALLALVLGLGVAEVAVEIPYTRTGNDQDGVGDLVVFAKFLLLGKDEASGMLTLKGEFKTTTGDEAKGLGSGYWEAGPSLVLSKELGPIIFHGQAGYMFVDDPQDKDKIFYGLAIDIPLKFITDKLTICLELIGEYNDAASPMSAYAGILFEVNDNLVLDFAYGKGINDDAGKEGYIINGGFTLVF